VSGGAFPRFSPDGARVLYVDDPDFPPAGLLSMFVVPADGGDPRPLARGFGVVPAPGSVGPLWSPDGTRVLFRGRPLDAPPDALDWWLAPVDGGKPTSAGARDLQQIDDVQYPCAWLPDDRILFLAGTTMEGINLFAARLSSTGQLEGPPRRLTTGPGVSWTPSVAGDGRVFLERIHWVLRLHEVALDPRSGRTVGEPRRLTDDPAPKIGLLSLTRDGSQLAFSSYSGPRERRNVEVRLRGFEDGRETVPVSVPAQTVTLHPRLSRGTLWSMVSRNRRNSMPR
jgi:Tol biopolymer transport system component